MVIANAENYIVANGILFCLIQQKKVFDTSIKCLLVVSEKFENSVFHMFLDTLLGAHLWSCQYILHYQRLLLDT